MSRILSSVFGGKLGLGEVDEMLPRATLSANEIDRQNHIMFLPTIDKTHPNAGTFRLVLQAENFSRLNHPPYSLNPSSGSAQASERSVLGESRSISRTTPDTDTTVWHN